MSAEGRYWEVDTARGVAVSMMIAFHIIVDLEYLGVTDIDPYGGTMGILAHSIGASFLLLVGICLTISLSRSERRMGGDALRTKYLGRGARTFAMGMLITLASVIVLEDGWIVFGVLHCIGISIILAFPLLRWRWPSLVLGTAVILLGAALREVRWDLPYLVWLGIRPPGFTSLDHFPLAPWYGVVLIGVFLGHLLYPGGRRRWEMGEGPVPLSPLGLVGRHALVIYFLHQPIILAAIYLSGLA